MKEAALAGAWDPAQYDRFRAERQQPFFDLLALVRPSPAMHLVDLGCGTGELSALLAERLNAASMLGVDSSEPMLAQARPRATDRVSFRRATIESIASWSAFDLVFSNAALHWVPDHESFLRSRIATLGPDAQLAVQMPKNGDHPSHRIAHALAADARFASLLGGYVSTSSTLPLERYAEILHGAGLRELHCSERIYGHELAATEEIVEWVKGTLLLPYLSRLEPDTGAAFVAAYRERLVAELGDRRPCFFPFRRTLLYGRKPA